MEFRARTLPQWVHLSAFLGEQGDTVFSLTWRMADAATMPKDRTTIEKYGTNPNIWVQLGGYPDSEKETESAPPTRLKDLSWVAALLDRKELACLAPLSPLSDGRCSP